MSLFAGRMLSRKALTLFCGGKTNSFSSVAAVRNLVQPRQMAAIRSYYCLSSLRNNFDSFKSTPCTCGGVCHSGFHTKGDKELAEFLTEEIATERNLLQKSPKLPQIEGFDVVTNGADITLNAAFKDEKIRIKLNVNHTVDTDSLDDELNPNDDTAEVPEMKSKPNFLIEIERGGKTLSFGCSFSQDYSSGAPEEQNNPEAYNDAFNIDELTLYDGDRKDSVYAASGTVLDGYLYDLMMNFLEERGVSNEFAERLVHLCTAYEHKLYIGLLENIKSFISK